MRDLFKKDYAQTSKAARQALAAQFLQYGRNRDEKPVTRYTVLREAIDLSLLAEDAVTALGAADEVVKNFAVNEVALREEVLSKVRLSSPEAARAAAQAYAELIQDAVDADAYDAASRAVPKAQAAARAAKDASLLEKIDALSKEIAELREEFGPAAKHRAILKENPADPEANAAYGAFLCLVKGEWEKGLPMLAKGADAKLREAAEKDLAAPADPREQAAAGDAWADLVTAERKAVRKAQLTARASHWYKSALPKLDGIAKLRVAARLDEWEKSAAKAKVRTAGGPGVDLLSWINPAEHSLDSQYRWSFRGRVLVSAPNSPDLKFTLLQVPCAPPPEYDVTVAVQLVKDAGPFGIGLAAGGHRFVVLLHGQAGPVTAGLFGGEDSHDISPPAPSDKLYWKGSPFTEGKPSVVVCSVRAKHFQVTLNGQVAIDWRNPPYAAASVPEDMEVPNAQALFLVARDAATYEVSQLTLKSVGGGAPRRLAGPAEK